MSNKQMVILGALALVVAVVVTHAVTKTIVTDRWAAEHPAKIVTAPAVPVALPVTPTPAAPPAEAPAPAVKDAPASTNLDLEAIVNGLTEEQRQMLSKELGSAKAERWRLSQRYAMPSDAALYGLKVAGRGKPELRLTVTQQDQLKALEEAMKAKLEAQLAGKWARMDELSTNLRGPDSAAPGMIGQDKKDDPEFKELSSLHAEQEAMKEALDEEYEALKEAVLSEAQKKWLADWNAQLAKWMHAVNSAKPAGGAAGGGPGTMNNSGGGGGTMGGGQ